MTSNNTNISFCDDIVNTQEVEQSTKEKEKNFSKSEMARFSAAICSYRIVRLSVELFLVVKIQELDMSISKAGVVYVMYAFASICAGLILMRFPTIGLGNLTKAIAYFVLSMVSMFGGFVGMFLVQSFGWMIAMGIVTGFGSAAWNINFQTISNMAFPREQLGNVAQFRQIFEMLGFLVPSVCLAIITNVGGVSNSTLDTTHVEENKSFVSSSILILALIGIGLSVLSCDQIILSASRIIKVDGEESLGIVAAMNTFFATSVVKYFLLNSLLLAMSIIIMGTLSLMTEIYFGLDPSWLWLAAVAFPIGGLFNPISTAIYMLLNLNKKSSCKSVLFSGILMFIAVYFCCIILGFILPLNLSNDRLNKSILFFFGLVVGMIYSSVFPASIELWLLRLKESNASFVSRASVINELAVQAVIASIFQLQTMLVDIFVEDDVDRGGDIMPRAHSSIIFFAPLIGICIICLIIVHSIPNVRDPIFGWPINMKYSSVLKCLVSFLEFIGASSAADAVFFSDFQRMRTKNFSEAPYLDGVTGVQRGPVVAETASLNPADFKDHLKHFVQIGSHNEEWWDSKATLCDIIVDNDKAFKMRLELIKKATSKVSLVTWFIGNSKTADQLVDALIKRAEEGVEVLVMVDAVTLYYSHQKKVIRGMDDNLTLERLAKAGVEVRMLDTIHDETESSYIIGNHRKILIVDETWVVTGGRNNSDRYFISKGFHYRDADVVLKGSFGDSICVLYRKLWEQARGVDVLFGISNPRVVQEIDDIEVGNQFVDVCHPPDLEYAVARDNQMHTANSTKEDTPSTEFFLHRKTGNEDYDDGDDDDINDVSVSTDVREESSAPDDNVTVFHLDHKAGNKDGYDIIYSTLIFLVETATERIDFVMGLFQLFPDMEAAIERAVARGVQISLTTNSDHTNGTPYLNNICGSALGRLLELGVKIFVPDGPDQSEGGGSSFCLHYKAAVFDRKVAFIGSWNCLGYSVFFDSDFSVVLFDNDAAGMGDRALFQNIENLSGMSKKAGMVQMKMMPANSFKVSFIFFLFNSRNGRIQMVRGY